ncbi:hypothetical protein [Longimicrobium sp.]|uniref:hypothetical protein n=1 Tax=Longimicrobium sp. TaxID=2029185 RepID=UPI002B7F123C|nr:hypothetical protein [Longimicrobium sp.]HSU17561.1 hypothetical protein [Longimicrobium sp.]
MRVPGGIVQPPAPHAGERADADGRAPESAAAHGLEPLRAGDPELYGLVAREHRRQNATLAMDDASGVAGAAVLACGGSPLANTPAGCGVAGAVERIAVLRARLAFAARYASVRPASGSAARELVLSILLRPGDVVLAPEADGFPSSPPGTVTVACGAGADGRIDGEAVRRLALEHRPRVIVCGASAHPRATDFAAFRRIADEAGAFLLADISPVAALVAAGEHPSPIDHAHFTITRTRGQLPGPRGGLVLMGRDHDAPAPVGEGTLSGAIERTASLASPEGPDLAAIAAAASMLAAAASAGFHEAARRATAGARALAAGLASRGWALVTGGTDTHLVAVDLSARGLAGAVAERALEECGMRVSRCRVPGDGRSPAAASGVRLGTHGLALRGMGPAEMARCAELVDMVLAAVRPVDDDAYELCPAVAAMARDEVAALCARFPIPGWSADWPPEVVSIAPPRATAPVDPFSLPAGDAA